GSVVWEREDRSPRRLRRQLSTYIRAPAGQSSYRPRTRNKQCGHLHVARLSESCEYQPSGTPKNYHAASACSADRTNADSLCVGLEFEGPLHPKLERFDSTGVGTKLDVRYPLHRQQGHQALRWCSAQRCEYF